MGSPAYVSQAAAIVADLIRTLFADRVRLDQRRNRALGQNDLAAFDKLAQQIHLAKAKHPQDRLPQPSFSDYLPEGKQGVARSAVSEGFAWRM